MAADRCAVCSYTMSSLCCPRKRQVLIRQVLCKLVNNIAFLREIEPEKCSEDSCR